MYALLVFTLLCFCVRYEVNFQEGLSCGGGYIKLLVQDEDYDPVSFLLCGLHVSANLASLGKDSEKQFYCMPPSTLCRFAKDCCAG